MTVDSTPLAAGDAARAIEIDGLRRSYLVHVPNSYTGREALPLVLAFHGGGSTPEAMIGFSGLSDKADAAGFIVAYPRGTGRTEQYSSWNGGNCCGHAQRYQIDDVKFVAALLDDLQQVLNIDAARIYATGFSNGAVLVYRLACELSDRIAAVAPIAGPLGIDDCQPARPVPVVHFHGDEDLFVPVEGGKGPRSLSRVDFRSIDDTLAVWVALNGCPAEPQVSTLPDRLKEGRPITVKHWGPGRDGAEVRYYLIHRGGHTWPGRVPSLAMLGPTTLNISANDLMWEFFERHKLPS